MQKKAKEKDIDFHGFSRPTYTQVPDDLFDFLLPFLDEKELKVLLYVIRRTLGWKKDSDMISLNQLEKGGEKDKGCGLKKRTIIRALQSLEEKKCIHIARAKASDGINQINTYSLHFKGEGGWCHARHYGSVSAGMGGSVTADTQQHTSINTNTTTVVVDFGKFRDYKDSIRVPLSEIAVNRIMMSHRCTDAELYAAADILDFQSRAGSNIIDYRKYLISLIKAIQRGTLGIPDGYQPPWERAELARQEAELQKKEKAELEKLKNESESERLTPEELENLKAKNAPALLAGAGVQR